MPNDDRPSDAQMTAEQVRRVDDAYQQDRELDVREDARTAAKPTDDDPAATRAGDNP